MPALLHDQIPGLVDSLAQHHGHRTVWMDVEGNLLHTEPEAALEDHGFEYVATLMRPDAASIRAALERVSGVQDGAVGTAVDGAAAMFA